MIKGEFLFKCKNFYLINGINFAFDLIKKSEVGVVMVTQIFISHSCKDISQATFLIHLFNSYHIKTWTSFIDLESGKQSKQIIDDALFSCDKLLVVVTEHTSASRWMPREISIFEKFNPTAEIIPLIFNREVNLDKISPGLEQYQFVDFTKDLTDGYKKLFAKFGIDFLVPPERRVGDDRRNGNDRRKHCDRRSKDLTLRLHKSFLKLCSENSLIAANDVIDLANNCELELFFESVKQGAKNYLCYDRIGNLYNTNLVLDLCLNQAWATLVNESPPNNGGHVKAKYLTLAVAKEMTHKFTVKCKDRRNSHDRRSGGNRR